jgi:hypothetical protein
MVRSCDVAIVVVRRERRIEEKKKKKKKDGQLAVNIYSAFFFLLSLEGTSQSTKMTCRLYL